MASEDPVLNDRQPVLNDRQRLFIEKYLLCLNATQAAKDAGYSERTARFIGCENLTKPNIRAEIERRLADVGMGKNEVIARLADHARGDMTLFMRTVKRGKTEEVVADLAGALRRGDTRLVRKAKFDAKGGVTIELYDAQRALATLAHVHGIIGKGKGGEDDGWDDDDDETEEQQERSVGDDELFVEAELARAASGE